MWVLLSTDIPELVCEPPEYECETSNGYSNREGKVLGHCEGNRTQPKQPDHTSSEHSAHMKGWGKKKTFNLQYPLKWEPKSGMWALRFCRWDFRSQLWQLAQFPETSTCHYGSPYAECEVSVYNLGACDLPMHDVRAQMLHLGSQIPKMRSQSAQLALETPQLITMGAQIWYLRSQFVVMGA